MDITNYTTEHKKGQHLLSEERHEIEVRLKDGWSIYRIAKHLERPYNTIKKRNQTRHGIALLVLSIIVDTISQKIYKPANIYYSTYSLR